MTYQKIDSAIFSFFQDMTNFFGRIGISLRVLINSFLIIQIGFQISQIVWLYQVKAGTVNIFLHSFPTLLILWYFSHVVKHSKKGPVSLDVMRIFGAMFVAIVVFSFIFNYTMKIISKLPFSGERLLYHRSEVSYMIACVAFGCLLYLLSCKGKNSKNNIKLLK